jgi:phage terminase large subunit-like protein
MPLTSDSSTIDGLNAHAAIIDELHAHRTRHVVDVLETATGARRQPLLFEITTAGYDRHSICYEHQDYSIKVLEGTVADGVAVYVRDPNGIIIEAMALPCGDVKDRKLPA